MDQHLFNFLTFELADYENFPALRFQRLTSESELYANEDRSMFNVLKAGIADEITKMKEEYSEEELTATEQMWTDFYVEQFGNELGIDLLVSAKASKETLMKAIALGDEGFDRVVARSVRVGNELNRRTKEVELQNKSDGNHTL